MEATDAVEPKAAAVHRRCELCALKKPLAAGAPVAVAVAVAVAGAGLADAAARRLRQQRVQEVLPLALGRLRGPPARAQERAQGGAYERALHVDLARCMGLTATDAEMESLPAEAAKPKKPVFKHEFKETNFACASLPAAATTRLC